MKKFVRGGSLLTVLSLCGVFYAQTGTAEALSSANDSQTIIENSIDSNTVAEDLTQAAVLQQDTNDQKGKKKKLVRKTVSTRSTAGGSFTATAYCLKGRTALGHGVHRGGPEDPKAWQPHQPRSRSLQRRVPRL